MFSLYQSGCQNTTTACSLCMFCHWCCLPHAVCSWNVCVCSTFAEFIEFLRVDDFSSRFVYYLLRRTSSCGSTARTCTRPPATISLRATRLRRCCGGSWLPRAARRASTGARSRTCGSSQRDAPSDAVCAHAVVCARVCSWLPRGGRVCGPSLLPLLLYPREKRVLSFFYTRIYLITGSPCAFPSL